MKRLLPVTLFPISFLSSFSHVNVTAGFNTPDTVCINSLVNIQNILQGATNYYWSSCMLPILTGRRGNILANSGESLSTPL